MSDTTKQGALSIIGVGPGDPELITLKAARLISEADVVVYPVTASGRARARRTAGAHITEQQTEFGYALPMAEERAPAQAAYDDVSARIRGQLEAGRQVALLCEGDPFLYGSAMYVFARLAGDYATHVVPGVTSLTASAAAAGRPLAGRNAVLKVVPAPLAAAQLKAQLAACDAAAIIKVGRHFEKVRRVIDELGLVDRAVMIGSATDEDQRVVPLDQVEAQAQPYFSTVLISSEVRT